MPELARYSLADSLTRSRRGLDMDDTRHYFLEYILVERAWTY